MKKKIFFILFFLLVTTVFADKYRYDVIEKEFYLDEKIKIVANLKIEMPYKADTKSKSWWKYIQQPQLIFNLSALKCEKNKTKNSDKSEHFPPQNICEIISQKEFTSKVSDEGYFFNWSDIENSFLVTSDEKNIKNSIFFVDVKFIQFSCCCILNYKERFTIKIDKKELEIIKQEEFR